MTKKQKMRHKKARAKYLKHLAECQEVRATGFDYPLHADRKSFKDHGKYYIRKTTDD
jgi:hypothetical protein